MIHLDLVSLVHNALSASGTRWAKVDYRSIFGLETSGRAEKVIGKSIEVNDGHQWMTVVYRTDQSFPEDEVDFKVEKVDMAFLKKSVHTRHGMEDCKGTLNNFLDVIIDRLAHYEFEVEILSIPNCGPGRKPSILRFRNQHASLTIFRMSSVAQDMSKYNVSLKETDNVGRKSIWTKLRLWWHRKSTDAG